MELWNLLTSDNIDESNIKYNTDSNEEIHGNIYAKQNKHCETNADPTIMRNLDGLIAPAEGQILVSYTNKPNYEALAFPKKFLTRQFHCNFKTENRLLC